MSWFLSLLWKFELNQLWTLDLDLDLDCDNLLIDVFVNDHPKQVVWGLHIFCQVLFLFVSAGDCCWSRVCCGWCLWRHYWGISYHWSCCSFCVWLCLTEDDTSVYNDQLCQLAYYLWCLTRSQSLNDVKKKVRWDVILLLRNPSSRHSSKSSINPPIKCVSHHWRYFDKLRI